MSLEILAAVLRIGQVKSCRPIGLTNESLLCLVTRHGYAGRSAVLVYTSLSNDAFNAVSVTQSLAESLEYDRSNSFLYSRNKLLVLSLLEC